MCPLLLLLLLRPLFLSGVAAPPVPLPGLRSGLPSAEDMSEDVPDELLGKTASLVVVALSVKRVVKSVIQS